jgi:hypothetical protein
MLWQQFIASLAELDPRLNRPARALKFIPVCPLALLEKNLILKVEK